jgi:hypothetical protein
MNENLIWTAEDSDGNVAELNRNPAEGNWELLIPEGRLFSGYPSVTLTPEDLYKLYFVLLAELQNNKS